MGHLARLFLVAKVEVRTDGNDREVPLRVTDFPATVIGSGRREVEQDDGAMCGNIAMARAAASNQT
jgi:hypothetical protein